MKNESGNLTVLEAAPQEGAAVSVRSDESGVEPKSATVGFTPGPWAAERQDDDSGEIYWAIHSRHGYEFITNVHDSNANARLVATSPELLAVVEEIVLLGAGKCTISKTLADMARAACRKVYGP